MDGYGQALVHVRDQLTAAGIPAVLDPTDLNDLPGAWVEPDSMELRYLDGSFDATVVVLLIANDNGVVESLDALTTMMLQLEQTQTLPLTEVSFTRAVLDNHSSDPLPAVRFRTTLHVSP